jgi:uncharacterized protein (TIGR02145 family)
MRHKMKITFILQSIALIGVFAISHASENWTGGGGKGMSIAIYAPEASGLAENLKTLPTEVQAELVSNFTDYSEMGVLDWERLGDIYDKLSSGVYKEQDLGDIERTTYIMTGKITKTATDYHLQMTIAKTSDKMTVASYSGTFSYWELRDRTGIRKASLQLLPKIGVALTEKAKKELAGAAEASNINGQTAFAKGFIADRQGNEVAALSYYFQAAAFDPSMKEAAKRSSVLNANIASGSMGDNVRNDIQWRKQWVERLKETEQFFDNFNKIETMPYTLFYSKDINQGKINYQNETVALSIETYLYGSEIWTVSIERALQAVYDGLNATGRKDIWELARWPQRGVTDLKAFERRSGNFSVVFELVNNRGRVIGRQTLNAGGSWGLNWSGRPSIEMSNSDRKTLHFQNVNANDITDNLTIRAASVNGTDAETAAIDGVLQIKAITKSEADMYDSFRFSRGELHGFANRQTKVTELVIPNAIWGDPVTSIGYGAFKSAGLTSVKIPSNVNIIGKETFGSPKLTSVVKDIYNKNGRKAGTYKFNTLGLLDPRDDQFYRTVKIGAQTWMAENLNYKTSEGSWCYDNKEANCDKYGRLYNWYTAIKACPKGWHLPSNGEWDKLYRFADGTNGTKSPYKSETAGKYLKSKEGWSDYKGKSGNGLDVFGFSALPGGYGDSDGNFSYVGSHGRWWSSAQGYSSSAYSRSMFYGYEYAYGYDFTKYFLQSVRCLQD